MKIIEIITEYRREPTMNPKENTLDNLKKIVEEHGSENVYVTFCKVNKFSLYPVSHFDTPIGICSYPIEYVIDKNLKVPYPKDVASKKHYMFIFKPKNPDKILYLQGDSFPLQSLAKVGSSVLSKNFDLNTVTEIFNKYLKKHNHEGKAFWFTMYNMIDSQTYPAPSNLNEAYHGRDVDERKASEIGIAARNILMQMGYQGARDDGDGIIYYMEPTQSIFFDPKNLTLLGSIINYPKRAIAAQKLAYVKAIKLKTPSKELESVIATNSYYSLKYAKHIGGKFPAGEPAIAKNPEYSLEYAKIIGRFPLGETAISKSANYSLIYARIIDGRFPLGEPNIIKSGYSLEYAKIIGDPHPETWLSRYLKRNSSETAQDPELALEYANMIGKRFPAGEPAIAKDAYVSLHYAELFGKFPAGEPEIAKNGLSSLRYARIIGRFPAGEPTIAKDEWVSKQYANIIGDPDPETWRERYLKGEIK